MKKINIIGVHYAKNIFDLMTKGQYNPEKDSAIGLESSEVIIGDSLMQLRVEAKEERYKPVPTKVFEGCDLMVCPFDLSSEKNRQTSILGLKKAFDQFKKNTPPILIIGLNIEEKKANITIENLEKELKEAFPEADFKDFHQLVLDESVDYKKLEELATIKNSMFKIIMAQQEKENQQKKEEYEQKLKNIKEKMEKIKEEKQKKLMQIEKKIAERKEMNLLSDKGNLIIYTNNQNKEYKTEGKSFWSTFSF